jgi:hypothetical protein
MSRGSSFVVVDSNGSVISDFQSPTSASGSFLNGALVGIYYDESHSTCASIEGLLFCGGVSNLMVFPSFNNPGNIDYQVATSLHGGGGGRVVILAPPVPEPASSTLLLSGLGSLLAGALMRARQRRTRASAFDAST